MRIPEPVCYPDFVKPVVRPVVLVVKPAAPPEQLELHSVVLVEHFELPLGQWDYQSFVVRLAEPVEPIAELVVLLAELVVRPVVHPVLLVELLEQLVELVVPHLVIAVKLAVHLVRLVVHLVLAGQILPQPRKFGRRSSGQLLQFGLYLLADCWMSVPLAVRLG